MATPWRLGSAKVRLFGIDAPEYGQKCSKRKSGVWPCGKEATRFLVELIGDQQVTCVSKGIDNYDRQIGVCSVGDVEVNASMVSSGMAWAFRQVLDSLCISGERGSKDWPWCLAG